jgi:16S rRNA (uracil1498-N3)-methyltransferase
VITFLARAGTLAAGAAVTLDPEEEHHLAVRRTGSGERVRLVDGAGRRAEGALTIEGRRPRIVVESVFDEAAPAPLILAVGAGDRERFLLLVEQATQLGATEIVPLETARAASVATKLREAHLERARRRAREALKQCGSAWAPGITGPMTPAEFVSRPRMGRGWLADAEGTVPGTLGETEPLTIAVGPEGGFTASEAAGFLEAEFAPVRLGPHLLRFETAAVAALTMAWRARERDRNG